MRQASIADLKARLSEYLHAVKAGEEVIVTQRGRPVARLGPVGSAARGEDRLAHLYRAGMARPPLRKLSGEILGRRGPADPRSRVLAALLAERREKR